MAFRVICFLVSLAEAVTIIFLVFFKHDFPQFIIGNLVERDQEVEVKVRIVDVVVEYVFPKPVTETVDELAVIVLSSFYDLVVAFPGL